MNAVFTMRLLIHIDRDLLQQRFIIGAVRTIDQEIIRLAPTGDTARLLDRLQQIFSYTSEHVVPIGFPVAVIDRMEMVDVHQDSIRRIVFVIYVQLNGIAEKEFLVV